VKFSRNTTQRVKFGVQAIAVFVGLLWVMLGPLLCVCPIGDRSGSLRFTQYGTNAAT
jgi:hypothetical protein